MKTINWFGGALVLSACLSLAMAGGAWAQSQERGSGSGSGSYGSEQGYQKGKKQASPSGSEGSMGICTPESCPGSNKSGSSKYTGPSSKKSGKGSLEKSPSTE